MNYKLVYDKIIFRAKLRIFSEDDYFEKHHIIPKCMMGTDDLVNIVSLTAKEHCLVHLLLVKIYPNVHELVYAAFMMYNEHGSCRKYEWLKLEVSKLLKKRIITPEWRKKISDANKGKWSWNKGKTGVYTEETLQKMRRQVMTKDHLQKLIKIHTGRHRSEESKKKMRENHKGMIDKKHSSETIMKIRNSNIGKHIVSEESKQNHSRFMKEWYRKKKLESSLKE